MRRLSIIDVSGGAQPVANEDSSVQVVFNGEIYNHRALRAELQRSHVLRSRSDTEVLVHLYEEHGVDMLARLRGMFAFALWDARRERLLVARDRLGIKPLYYWPTEGGVVFGSELRSFLCLRDFPRRVSRSSMTRYLGLGYVPDPHAIFDGVQKLPPGHFFTWSQSEGLRVRRNWSAPRSEQDLEFARRPKLRRLLDQPWRLTSSPTCRLARFSPAESTRRPSSRTWSVRQVDLFARSRSASPTRRTIKRHMPPRWRGPSERSTRS